MSEKEQLDMIEHIYDFHDVDKLFQWFYPQLKRIVEFQSAVFMPFQSGSYLFQEHGSVTFNVTAGSVREYLDHFHSKAPLFAVPQTIKKMMPNKGVRVNKMLPAALYKQTTFYKEFLLPRDVHWSMLTLLVSCDIAIGGLAIHRSEKAPSFSKMDKEVVDRVAAHLARAIFLCSAPKAHIETCLDEQLNDFNLSKRQKEVVRQLFLGHSNQEIASRLFITEQTVKDHLHIIYQKLSVNSRTQLITMFQRSAN